MAYLPLPDEPLLLLAAVSFPGLPALAFVLTRHRSRPPWAVVLSATAGIHWRQADEPMHTSDPETQACSGLAPRNPRKFRYRPRIVSARCPGRHLSLPSRR